MAATLTIPGRALLVQTLGGGGLGVATPGFMGIGTGPGSATTSAVALFGEVAPRGVLTVSAVTVNVAGDTVAFTAAFTAAAPQTVTNAGLFSAASAGTLLAMADFGAGPLAMNTGDTLQLQFQLTLL